MSERSTLVGQTNDAMCVLRASDAARTYGIDDTYAPWFITEGGERIFALGSSIDPTFVDYNLARYVASTRVLTDAGARGAQIVVLGVGSDCRPLSLPELSSSRLFLLDQPAVLAHRAAVLADHGVVEPANITSIPIDLSAASVPDALRLHGFRPEHPTLVLAEGVLCYLPEAAAAALVSPTWLGKDAELWCDLWTRPRVDLLNAALLPRLGTKLFHAHDPAALPRLGWRAWTVVPLERVAANLGHKVPDVAPDGWLLVHARTR